MSNAVAVKRVCIAHFFGQSNLPSEEALATYLPTGMMARLPNGKPACAIVACRVSSIDTQTGLVHLDVRVASVRWHDTLQMWIEAYLLPALENAIGNLVALQRGPTVESEFEMAAYYARGIQETAVEFEVTHGVRGTARFEYLAGFRRRAEQRAARERREAARLAVISSDDTSTPMSRVMSIAVTCGKALAFPVIWLFDLLFPPVVQESGSGLRQDPKDLWAEKTEVVSSTILRACEKEMGSLLRRVSIIDPNVAEELEEQGVAAGYTATMVAARDPVMTVSWDASVDMTKSVVLDIAAARAILSAGSGEPDGAYEVVVPYRRKR